MVDISPLVSIIVPIYNVEKYIGDCLDSLFSQTYKNLDYIFVNDNTPDRSIDILRDKITQYGLLDKVEIINNKTNIGLAGVRKIGIKAAKGDYITIVDSDDMLSVDAIEKMINCAIKNNADIVESNFYLYSDQGLSEYNRPSYSNKDIIICNQLSLKTAIALWSKLYKKELFSDVDNLFIVGSKNIEDYYATPVLYDRANTIAHLSDHIYYYRIDNVNSGSRNREWSKIKYLVIAVKHHEEFFANKHTVYYDNAIKEAKYYIIMNNYLKMSSDDKRKLSLLFPEIDSYVRNKGVKIWTVWWLIRHDYSFVVIFLSRLINLYSNIYGKLKTYL